MTIDWDKTLVPTATVQASCTESDNEEIFKSSKILLSDTFSELRFESGTHLHYVQLYLTSAQEIIVLNIPTDRSPQYSFLRRHKICQSDFSMHPVFYNAFTVFVPHTVLKHVYQCTGQTVRTAKDWLSKLSCCKKNHSDVSCIKKNDPESKLNFSKDTTNSALSPGSSSSDQSTSYQHKDESLLSYSSPSLPASPKSIKFNKDLPPVSLPSQLGDSHELESSESVETPIRILDTKTPVPLPLEIVQLPSGLIKARSFQGRGSVKERFVRSSSTMSGLNEIEQSRTTSESSTPHTSTPLSPHTPLPRTPSPSIEVNPFKTHLHHTQIRNRKWKFSPRITQSGSPQVDKPKMALNTISDKHSRSANSTPIPGAANPLPTTVAGRQRDKNGSAQSEQSNNFFTLPRRTGKKSHSHDGTSNRESAAVSNPTTSLTPSTKTPFRSPNLLRMFHRRWQSSSAIKVPFNVNGDETSRASTPDSSEGVTTRPSTPIRNLHQYSPKEVAEELSLMDAELLRKISPKELENGAWTKKDKEKMAPNVMAMVRSFNQLALLITSEILNEKTAHDRAKVISSYIQIASKCYSQHNYNSLKAVLAGLQSTPIFRLTKTWKEVPSKKRKRFKRLSSLMSEGENWQLYREEINRKLVSGTPFIPFLGLFLTQVVQMESYIEVKKHRMNNISPTNAPSNAATSAAVSKPLPEAKAIKNHTRSSSFSNCPAQSNISFAVLKHKTSQDKRSNSLLLAPSSKIPVSVSDDDSGLRNVLHTTLAELSRLSKSLQSLDSVFSEDEIELNTSMNQMYSDLDSDLDQTNGNSSPAPQDDGVTVSLTVCSTSEARRTLFSSTQSEDVQSCCSISTEPEQLELPSQESEQDNRETKHTFAKKDNKHKFKYRKSLDSLRAQQVKKKFLKISLRKRKSRKLINVSNDHKSYEMNTPPEMLNHYQVASLGCSMGTETNRGLRSTISDAEPNTESSNYRLSIEREALD